MKKRCVIVGAAPINNYKRISSHINAEDFIIFCDGGLKHRSALSLTPDLIIGDFDSHKKEDFPYETIVLPHVKDDTDTAFAAKEGLKRGFNDFLLIGCLGLRIDHSLGNLSLLLMLHNSGAFACLLDDYSLCEIVSTEPVFVSDKYPYFSLNNIDGTAGGIFVENALYPLNNAVLNSDFPLGISNEPLPGKEAKIWVESGKLLLVKVFDK